ncbi:hypothetical protein [Nonomuraea basaltis]|nr:hypothetical protein [Nonomuraea basaltis]
MTDTRAADEPNEEPDQATPIDYRTADDATFQAELNRLGVHRRRR